MLMNPMSLPLLLGLGVAWAAGLTLLALWRRGDQPRGRRRCPGCWYEFGPTIVARCPECGRAVLGEHELHRTRRRLALLAGAVVLLLLPPLAMIGTRRLARVYYALMPRWRTVSTHDVGVHRILVQKVRDPEDFGERCVIKGTAGEPLIIEDVHLWIGSGMNTGPIEQRIGIGDDLTGDGVPDLIVSTYSGGAHCCLGFRVVSLTPAPMLVAEIDAQNGGDFFRAVDGVIEYRGVDWTYAYWNSSFVASPRPGLVLRWNDGRFAVDAPAMLKPLPPEAELAAAAEEIRRALVSTSEAVDIPPPERLGALMLELMYTGHEARAWALLDEAWPGDVPGKDVFAYELRHLMSQSAYWNEFRALVEATPR